MQDYLPFRALGTDWRGWDFIYFEALDAIRESVTATLNGTFQAALAILRCAFEMLVMHLRWSTAANQFVGEPRGRARTAVKFKKWRNGIGDPPPTGNAIDEVFARHAGLAKMQPVSAAHDLYARLCRFAHTPRLQDSLSIHGGGSERPRTADLAELWLALSDLSQRILLERFIVTYPMCLFPVDLIRKFGFGGPVGALGDANALVALRKSFGDPTILAWQQQLERDPHIVSLLEWYESREDLSPEEAVASDDAPPPNVGGESGVEFEIAARYARARARNRALARAMAASN